MYKIIYAVIAVLFFSCNCPKHEKTAEQKTDNNSLTMAVLYMQHAEEFKALTLQAYNIAKYRLSEAVKKNKAKKKLAVVLDIDETVLDNSPHQAKQVVDTINYPTCWDEWCKYEKAELIPGVKDFLLFADSLDVNIFYISNRKHHLMEATVNNLNLHNLPQADTLHVLLRTDSKSKEARRSKVIEQGNEIVLMLGDNLGDFSEIFDTDDIQERNNHLKSNKNLFGEKYIVLPNPSYGKWADNLGLYKKETNKDSLSKALLKSFDCK